MNAEGETVRSKLVIDEDWKTRVESEKAELEKRRGSEAQPEGASETVAPATPAADAAPATARADGTGGAADSPSASDPQLPAASMGSLIMMLASQAMMEMGQIPDPVRQKRTVRKSAARHYIDTLEVLEEKTKGNLTSEESRYLTLVLNELRMGYLQLKS